MSASFLEIVELANGDFALQRIDEDGETLLTISFSKETKDFLQENNVAVARAMINAGIQTVGSITSGEMNSDSDMEKPPADKTIH